MSKEIAEINQPNVQIQRNVAAKEKADRAQREADQETKIAEAIEACRVPVLLAAATLIAAAMGLASADLVPIIGLPCMFWVAYQAGTVR